ncbi:MAG: glycosyltransferase family 4 protein [Chthonomonadales bacterium]|nr:glycosyltransferase family 4 protein [Chthonomonadales bacterium]
MVAPTPYFADRGCHVRIYEEARAQKAIGNDVRVVTYHLGRDEGDIPTDRTVRVPWYNKRDAGPSPHKVYLDALLLLKTLAVARRYRPHVLHAHLHEGILVALPVARLLRIPAVFDVQGSLVGEMANHGAVKPGGAAWRTLRRLEAATYRWADGLLLTNDSEQALQRDFDLEPRRVFSLRYGVDCRMFRPHAPESLGDLRATLGLPAERRIIVFLGVLSAYQGVDCLLEAAPRVLARCPDAHFLVMGYPHEKRYRAVAAERGVAERVTLPGRIDYARAARYLSLGEVAVSPKLTDAEGNGKLFNYMACGLPTVAFDMPGNRAVLANTGVYAPVGDARALADALLALLEQPERGLALGRAARERAEREFSWEATARETDRMYAALIERRGGARAC